MPRTATILALLLFTTGTSFTSAYAEQAAEKSPSTPLVNAHAHNDYWHKRPLFHALDNGFCSVEADIFLVDDRLLVGHEKSELLPENTLEALYLKPLHERVKKNGGRVFRDGPIFWLWIDLKSPGEPTYRALHKLLEKYADMLTSVEDGQETVRAIRVIISGDRPIELMKQQDTKEPRLAAIDGRLSDLDSKLPPHLMPVISDNWRKAFKYRGKGSMPNTERAKLDTIIQKAHAAGRRVRFWATPENESLWQTLRDADVDLINTDQLHRLRDFLKK